MSWQIRCESCDLHLDEVAGVRLFSRDPDGPFSSRPHQLDFCHYGCVELWARAQNGN